MSGGRAILERVSLRPLGLNSGLRRESIMSDDESLITPAMEAAIGIEGEPREVTVDKELVLRLMHALDEEDEELIAAVEAGDATYPIPTYALLTTSTSQRQMSVPDAPERALMAADAWEVKADIHLGDTMTIVPRLAEIQERIGGRVGHSLFIHHEWVYTNQDDVEVARVRRTVAHFQARHTGE